jgi:hypothetical protein
LGFQEDYKSLQTVKMLAKKFRNGGNFYKDLVERDPHVVSITFWRDDPNELNENGERPKTQRLGIMIEQARDDDDEDDGTGGDYQIADLEDNPDAILYGMPIEIGDLLVAINSQSCYGLDINLLKQMIASEVGLVTLTLRRTRMAPFQDEIRLAVFIDSNKHTYIPTDLTFFKEQDNLAIFSLYDQFDDADDEISEDEDKKNNWLEASCLAGGQVVLEINGDATHELEEEEAIALVKDSVKTDDVLAIKTWAPSKASKVEQVDMVERITSYMVQLQIRMDRALAQARNDNVTLDYNACALPVYASAAQLSSTFRGSYNRCTSITSGKALYRLYLVMEDVWSKYAKLLSCKFQKDNRFTKILRKTLPMDKRDSKAWFPTREDQLQKQELIDNDDNDDAIDTDSKDNDDEQSEEKEEEEPHVKSRGWFFSKKEPTKRNTAKRSSWFGRKVQTQAEDTKQESTEEEDTKQEGTKQRGWFSRNNSIPPQPPREATPSWLDPRDKEAKARMTVCHILSTGYFCMEQMDLMQEKIKKTIDEKYKFQIEFEDTKVAFDNEVIEKGLRQLTHSVQFQLEPIFSAMTRLKWHSCDEVGDTSPYVADLMETLNKRVTSVALLLPESIHQKFKFNMVQAVCEKYYTTLIKIHRISPVGTQQLLLDVCSLKSELLGMLQILGPTHKTNDGEKESPKDFINQLFKKTEALLKLAGTNVEVDELLVQMETKSAKSVKDNDDPEDIKGNGKNSNDYKKGNGKEKTTGEKYRESTPAADTPDPSYKDDDQATIVFSSLDNSDISGDAAHKIWRDEALEDVI